MGPRYAVPLVLTKYSLIIAILRMQGSRIHVAFPLSHFEYVINELFIHSVIPRAYSNSIKVAARIVHFTRKYYHCYCHHDSLGEDTKPQTIFLNFARSLRW